MNKKIWFYLEAMILIEGGMTQFEILSKGIPSEYVTLAKENLDKLLNK